METSDLVDVENTIYFNSWICQDAKKNLPV